MLFLVHGVFLGMRTIAAAAAAAAGSILSAVRPGQLMGLAPKRPGKDVLSPSSGRKAPLGMPQRSLDVQQSPLARLHPLI